MCKDANKWFLSKKMINIKKKLVSLHLFLE